jgi:sulfate transport system ATP-binding protein
MDALVSNEFNSIQSRRKQSPLHWERAVDVKIEGVVRTFGATAALHGVSLDIQAGELIALLGPSGSGKTTLLRILAGLDVPTSGRVLFDGEDALRLTVQERNVGLVFQNYALFKHMNVLQNVGFGLRVRPRSRRPAKQEIEGRAGELLDFVQLSGLGGRYPNQLSGGQRQRVAFARALAIEPRVLLLDEPFGALDAKVRRDLRRWLREVHDRTGHTTVFVTHDQEEALELADRVVVLNHGRIEQVGTPDEIYDSPASPFVFSFIGESSELPVRVQQETVFLDDQRLGLDAKGYADGPARLFFRPQDVELGDGADGSIPGVVGNVRRHGGVRRADLELGESQHRVEVEIPQAFSRFERGEVSILPRRWRLYPESAHA